MGIIWKLVWNFVVDCVVKNTNNNGDIVIQGFGFDLIDGYYEG